MESSSSSSTSSSNHNREEEEEEEQSLLRSPCHFIEQLINSSLKCLGLDHHRHYYFSPTSGADERSPSEEAEYHYQEQTETEMKLGEEEGVVMATERSTRALRVKRSIGSGSGPKINVASS